MQAIIIMPDTTDAGRPPVDFKRLAREIIADMEDVLRVQPDELAGLTVEDVAALRGWKVGRA
jgi:hypothetical protein